jgi:hypothetical protein
MLADATAGGHAVAIGNERGRSVAAGGELKIYTMTILFDELIDHFVSGDRFSVIAIYDLRFFGCGGEGGVSTIDFGKRSSSERSENDLMAPEEHHKKA